MHKFLRTAVLATSLSLASLPTIAQTSPATSMSPDMNNPAQTSPNANRWPNGATPAQTTRDTREDTHTNWGWLGLLGLIGLAGLMRRPNDEPVRNRVNEPVTSR